MVSIVEKNQNRVLIKHTGAIHSSSRLTYTQKLIFNNFLFHAYKSINEDKYHTMSCSDVFKILGWSSGSHVNDWLKEELAGLTKQNVRWNILGKDKKREWAASACLADVRIKDGIISFSFSKLLRELLSSPNIYAKLDLDVQVKLESKESMSLWEFLSEVLDVNRVDSANSDWIEWKDMVKILSGSDSSYSKNYSMFKLRSLSKAVKQINESTNLTVDLKEKKEGRKVRYISFGIHRKSLLPPSPTSSELKDVVCKEPRNLLKRLSNFLTEKTALALIKKHDEEIIENALDYVEETIQKKSESIKNPVAFLKKAVQEGWKAPGEIRERINTIELDDKELDSICNHGEHVICKELRKAIYRNIGRERYLHWFDMSVFLVEARKVKIFLKSGHERGWVDGNHYHDIERIIWSDFSKELDGFCLQERSNLEIS